MCLVVAVGAIGAGSLGIGGYEASQSSGITSAAESLSGQEASESAYYNKILQGLISNPSSFLQSSLFQSSLQQGLGAAQTSEIAQGYGGSGNEASALESYGQSQASGELLSYEQLLGNLVTGTQSNASSSLNSAASSQASTASQISGLSNTAVLGALLGGYFGQGGNAANLL